MVMSSGRSLQGRLAAYGDGSQEEFLAAKKLSLRRCSRRVLQLRRSSFRLLNQSRTDRRTDGQGVIPLHPRRRSSSQVAS